MLLQIIALSLLCLLLIYGTGLIVGSIKSIAKRSRLATFGITAFILAISTTLPELTVSLVASFEGKTSLVLGNIIGSNIANLSLVIAGAAILGKSLKITDSILNRDIYLTGAAGFLPLLLIADQTLSRADGVVLLVVYLVMIATFLKNHQQSVAKNTLSTPPFKRLLLLVRNGRDNTSIINLVFGVALMVGTSHFIVQLATALAISSGLSTIFIGLFIVAVGTSLPELAFSLKAIRSGQTQMALGDLLGSVVANSTFILGISAVIRPMTLTDKGLLPYGMAIAAFTIIYLVFIIFVRTKKRLDSWEGLILIAIYIVFILIELGNS